MDIEQEQKSQVNQNNDKSKIEEVSSTKEDPYTKISPEFEEMQKDKYQLFDQLPAPILVEDKDFERQFEIYINLSKDNNSPDQYFVSNFNNGIKQKKEYLYPEENLEKFLKDYNIQEYATNLSPEQFDPQQLISEVKQKRNQQFSLLQQQQANDAKKTKTNWDQNQPNYSSNFLMMGMPPTSLNSLAMIAANNKAFMKSK